MLNCNKKKTIRGGILTVSYTHLDLVVGEMMFESRNGAPFLLRCNISDIMSDCQVSIFNPDGTVLTWSPSISLKDLSLIHI